MKNKIIEGIKQEIANLIYECNVDVDDPVYDKVENLIDRIVKQAYKQGVENNRDKVKKFIENLPAFTPCSDKTMGKVANEVKKARYGTNYLERETILKYFSKE